MGKCSYIFKLLNSGGFSIVKTVCFNLRVLPFKQAKKLPIAVSRYVKLDECKKGSVVIEAERITPLMILLGFGGSPDLIPYNSKKSYLSIRKSGKLVFKGKAQFAPHFSLLVSDAVMTVGDRFSCNNSCVFSCVSGLTIGDGCLFGGGITIRDSDGHKIIDLDDSGNIMKQRTPSVSVHIGNHVWMCNKCDVLKGVSIGDNNIIGYGTLCTKSISGNNQIIAGQPGRVVKSRVDWDY